MKMVLVCTEIVKYLKNYAFYILGVTVVMATNDYVFSEDSATVEVCAEISAPDDGLECDVVTTLTFTDGSKAGKIAFFLSFVFLHC